jgi:hypothetical protein
MRGPYVLLQWSECIIVRLRGDWLRLPVDTLVHMQANGELCFVESVPDAVPGRARQGPRVMP